MVYQYTRKKVLKIPEDTHNFPKYTQNCKERSIVVYCGHSFYNSELRGEGGGGGGGKGGVRSFNFGL